MFNQSGRGCFDSWDWARHPIAEVLHKHRPDLVQLFVTAIVRTSVSSSTNESSSASVLDGEVSESGSTPSELLRMSSFRGGDLKRKRASTNLYEDAMIGDNAEAKRAHTNRKSEERR